MKYIILGVIMFSFIWNLFKSEKILAERLPITDLTPSEKAYDIIKEFEGLRLEAYQCSANVWTIGYGTTIYPNGNKVEQKDMIPDEKTASTLLDHHVNSAVCPELRKHIHVPLKQTEYDALCSFVYNLGPAGLFTSIQRSNTIEHRPTTIVRLINQGEYTLAADQFERWVYADGQRLEGLERRRKAEKELFLS